MSTHSEASDKIQDTKELQGRLDRLDVCLRQACIHAQQSVVPNLSLINKWRGILGLSLLSARRSSTGGSSL